MPENSPAEHVTTDYVSAEHVIAELGLQPLPGEGGMWAQSWRDEHSTAIYFLLQPNDFSALHRLDGTELWHYYSGAPVQMLLLDDDGADGAASQPVLGTDLAAGERPMVPVPAGVWMAASTTGAWSLIGTTMAPGFDEAGFELADAVQAEELAGRHPTLAEQIRGFVRETG